MIAGSGVDLSLFTFKPEAEGTPVVLMAARLLVDKGVPEFVHAAQVVRNTCDAEFMVAGEPDVGHPNAVAEKDLLNWHEQGVISWVRWCDDVHILNGAKPHRLPSLLLRQGDPRVLLEAAACGRAMIATDHPGVARSSDTVRMGCWSPPGITTRLLPRWSNWYKSPTPQGSDGRPGSRTCRELLLATGLPRDNAHHSPTSPRCLRSALSDCSTPCCAATRM